MGEVELRREQRGDQSLVFGILPTGLAIWGMDLVSRQEWWYAPEYEPSLGPVIHAHAVALAHPDAAVASIDRFRAATAPPTQVVAAGEAVDLGRHRPGHSVLAQIATKHAASASTAIGDAPGVLDDDIVQWCVGYVGEERVGSLLEALGPGWKVLHAVPVGTAGSDIDHVVIGPGGVFTINAKHHAAQTVEVKGEALFVGGTHTFYIRNAQLEAGRATRVISAVMPGLTAYPIVAVVGGTVRVKEAPSDVYVMNSAALSSWLLGLPSVLTPEQVADVYAAMRLSTSWTTSPPPPAAPEWVAEFARHLANERAATTRPRGNRSSTSRPGNRSAKARGPKSRPGGSGRTRSGSGSRSRKSRGIGVEFARLIAGLAVLGIIVWQAPGWIQGVTDRAKQRQQITIAEVPVERPGSGCTQRYAEAVTASGKSLVCARVPGSAVLRWKAA